MKNEKTVKLSIFAISTIVFAILDLLISTGLIRFVEHHGVLQFGPFLLTLATHNGAAFGIFQSSVPFLILFTIFSVSVIIYYLLQNYKSLVLYELIFFGLMFAGIFVNLSERIRFGYIRDVFGFWVLPVCNLSDFFINIGVIVLIIALIKTHKTTK